MAVIYSATASLDGYVADVDGDFAFAAPDEELHRFVNEVFSRAATVLCGRRTYELMDYWDTLDLDGDADPAEIEFATHWRAADKIVLSRTLERVTHPRTTLERDLDAGAIRALATGSDVIVGGPTLAAEAFRADLVDEVWTFLVPVTVGAGLPMLPTDHRLDLDLVEHRRFGSGAVGLHYRVRTA